MVNVACSCDLAFNCYPGSNMASSGQLFYWCLLGILIAAYLCGAKWFLLKHESGMLEYRTSI